MVGCCKQLHIPIYMAHARQLFVNSLSHYVLCNIVTKFNDYYYALAHMVTNVTQHYNYYQIQSYWVIFCCHDDLM